MHQYPIQSQNAYFKCSEVYHLVEKTTDFQLLIDVIKPFTTKHLNCQRNLNLDGIAKHSKEIQMYSIHMGGNELSGQS
jgi:hypothetical protein